MAAKPETLRAEKDVLEHLINDVMNNASRTKSPLHKYFFLKYRGLLLKRHDQVEARLRP